MRGDAVAHLHADGDDLQVWSGPDARVAVGGWDGGKGVLRLEEGAEGVL